MTMTTHTGGPSHRMPSPSARRIPSKARPAAADLAADLAARRAKIGQFCRIGLTILLAGGALAGIIALKTMVYFWRFNYY
jgi:hypothetical protein